MSLKSSGFTVSGRFSAKKSIGTCPQCQAAFVCGEASVFVKARMDAEGRADAPLSVSQRREYSRLFRQAQQLGRERGILPRMTRYGRLARRQRPVSLSEVNITPDWMFDHMIHFYCLPAFAGGARVRDIAGHVGSRTAGVAHGVALCAGETVPAAPEAVPTPQTTEAPGSVEVEASQTAAAVNAETMTPAERTAAVTPTPGWAQSWARSPEARRSQAEARAARQAAAIERGREQMAAHDAEVATQIEEQEAALENAQADRFARVVDAAFDDDTPAPLAEPESDPSIERFRLLQID